MSDHRRPRVLVCDPIADAGVALLRRHLDVDLAPGLDRRSLLERVRDYEALVVRSATRVDAELIERAERLRVVARAGAGLDNVDVQAALARGIQVVYSPDANTLAVAELTMAFILALARNLVRADRAMKEGKWAKSELAGTGLAGKTLGIVGFGRVGKAVAVRARAFGMQVVTNQHRPTPELYLEAGVDPVDLYDLLARSDFVTLHVPLRPDTEGLIGRQQLAAMKPTAYLVNTSRAGVVDDEALLDALDRGTIAGAALDVFTREPAVDDPLAAHPKVIATPHLGASTEEAQMLAAVDVAEQLVKLLGEVEARAVLPLRFVPIGQVTPHEATHRGRVEELARRIEEEGMVRNPPVVTRVDDGFVLLDGATRTEAARRLGCRDLVVLDVDTSGLELETWQHVARGVEVDSLLQAVQTVEGVACREVDPDEMRDRLIAYGGLCAITTVDGRGFLLEPAPGVDRFAALGRVAAAYGEVALVSRTLERDLRRLAAWYPDMAALIEYPEMTVEQVLLAARSGNLLPAGVTRFVVPGRVLRLDVPLASLREETPLEEKNRRLHDLLADKERSGEIRYYREPVYVLDE